MSRPQETTRAAERLKARDALDRITPALAALRRAIRDDSHTLTSACAERLLCDLFDDLALVEDDSDASVELSEASAVDPAAAAMIAYAKASRGASNVSAVRAEIEQMATAANTKQAKALLNLIVAASQSPKVPTYTEALLDELLAAGLTNGITAPQRKALAGILGDPDFGKARRGVATPAVSAAPRPLLATSWSNLPDPVSGFTFQRDKVYQNALHRAVIEAGLPPAKSIDFFVADGAFNLANLEDDCAKANFAWRSMKAWLEQTGVSDARLHMHRKHAWTFLMGHVHGFLAGVSTIDKVMFASPWVANEVILAKRIAGEQAEVPTSG